MKVEERPHGCLADAEGKWRLHPIPVREGNMTVESNFPPRRGFGPAISCHLEAHIRPRFEPRPGFEPGTDPGFQQRSGIGGGRSFIINIRSKPKSLTLFLFFFLSLRSVRLDTWSGAPRVKVGCRVAEPIERELLSSIARLLRKGTLQRGTGTVGARSETAQYLSSLVLGNF
jgi:hypothetical protein